MNTNSILIGSHVSMSGREMMAGSVREALSYGANTFMLYTGAPQNTRRKPVEELCIPQAHALMEQNGIRSFIVHAPISSIWAIPSNPKPTPSPWIFWRRSLPARRRWEATP